MVFVDGSNMLVEMFRVLGVNARAEKATATAFQAAMHAINVGIAGLTGFVAPCYVLRRYWFGSVQGSPEDLAKAQEALRSANFDAVLFQKRQGKEKGVDLAVAREMLMQGFLKNYDAAIFVAGDEDYIGLVQDVKRLGLVTIGMFFEVPALSPRLKVTFDHFARLESPENQQPALIAALRAERAG
jgi:uncharacterized LabA/DUF88 family protein